tara:strand:- start:469 stop:1005 length:537 start_codon:yes stop_codon:yes gene_type:complete
MPNYQDSKIYKIVNPENNLVYYGQTTRELKHRYWSHKSKFNGCSSSLLFKSGTQYIELVENYPCETKKELDERELYYIENNDCVNIHKPRNITKKERAKEDYLNRDKEKFKKQKKREYQNQKEHRSLYYKENKERILEKNKKIINCYCGVNITFNSRARHERSNKHKNYIDSLYSSIY